jgi:hypothetical protein
MSNKWLSNIRHVAAGEPVQANVVSRPDTVLETRTNYLKDRLDAAALGQALFDVDATIAEDVLEGQPVFWNYQTQQYEKAIVAVESDAATQALVPQASSDCLGLLYRKKTNTLGDIVLRGIVKLPNITNAIEMPVAPGRYYLSATQPGKLTNQRPDAPVSVCYVQGAKDNCAAEPWIVVMPQVHDFLSDHTHYRFELAARAIGTVTTASGRVTVTTADGIDVTIETGWLPADHSSFNDKAPANAAFGYNLQAHPELSAVWPPVPMMAVAMLWDKGATRTGAFEIPLGQEGLVVCDSNGIWWMSDCVDDVPWVSTTSSSSSADAIECPRNERMRVIVTFLRMLFGNNKNVVTSLYSAPTSPIRITNCTGGAATTGDLELALILQLLIAEPEVTGGKAIKEIDTNNKFRRGWLTEGVFSNNEAIVLTGTHEATRTLTDAEKEAFGVTSSSVTLQQGLVRVAFNDPALEREIAPQIIRLSDVVERLYYDIPYLAFPYQQESALRLRFNVPISGLSSSITMRVNAQLLSRGVGANGLAPLAVTYRRLARPSTTPINLEKTESTDTLSLVYASSIAADKVVEATTGTFTVLPGDTVLVSIKRPQLDVGISYPHEIGLLRVAGVIDIAGT